jgi:hypothetical protein
MINRLSNCDYPLRMINNGDHGPFSHSLDPLSLFEPARQPRVFRHRNTAGHLRGLPVLSTILKGRRLVPQQVGRRGELPLLRHHHVVIVAVTTIGLNIRRRDPANRRRSRRRSRRLPAVVRRRHNVAGAVVRDLFLLRRRRLGLEGGEQGDGPGDLFAVLQVSGRAVSGLTGRNVGDGGGVEVDGAVALAGGGRLRHAALLALAGVDGARHAPRHLSPAAGAQRVTDAPAIVTNRRFKIRFYEIKNLFFTALKA